MSLHIPGTPNVRTDLPLPAPACEIGRMDHCWHREGSPTREARKGAKQVRCCFCDATGWAVMRRNTGPELVQEARVEAGQEARIAEVWILRRRYGDGSSVIHGVFADRLDALRTAEEEEARRRGGECLTAVWTKCGTGDVWSLPERQDRWPARISWVVDWFPVQRAGRPS